MLKIIRKHNKWLMVGFGILLMIAFTAPELIQRIGHAAANPTVATINGVGYRQSDLGHAHQELMALERFVPVLLFGFGMEPRDTTHWLLLTQEARDAGLVGNAADGRDFLPELAQMRMHWELQRLQRTDPQQWIQYLINEEMQADLVQQIELAAPRFFAEAHLNEEQMYETLAKLRGVLRLVVMHNQAARYSDRYAITVAKDSQDSAIIDYLFIRADDFIGDMPEPTQAELEAHFEEFRDFRPGEGEYGIGYTLPQRARLEWLKLDRAAMARAVPIDPVDVRRRHLEQRSRYPGEFAEERARIESDMREEQVERLMQVAHSTIHAEVLAGTRRLQQEGRFRRIPENWDDTRPRMENLALSVVEAVGRGDGPSIPLPEVHVRDDRWLQRDDIRQLEGLGQAYIRRGDLNLDITQLVFSAREFNGQAPFPVQVGIPLVENFLTDDAGNRYYLTILAARPESPPDSVDEIRDRAVRDYKRLMAFRQLTDQLEGMRRVAIDEGLAAVTQAIGHPGPAPEIQRAVRISRESSHGDPNMRDPDLRDAIVRAAANIDPLTPTEEIDRAQATVAVPSSQALAIAVTRILAKAPLTAEDYRMAESELLRAAQAREMQEIADDLDNPFSIVSLLRRNEYIRHGERIQDPEELRTQEDLDLGAS